MNIEKCRKFLSVENADIISDEELILVCDELQRLAEVFVEHALKKDFNNKVKLSF